MKRVLVTGADGSIGRAAVDGLHAAGYDVTGLSLRYDHSSTADRALVGDARSASDVAAALDGVDAVLHLAAIPHPSLGTPEEVFENNVAATFNVLSQAGQRGIGRVVIASSINAFGVPMNVNPVVPAYYPLDEEVRADISDAVYLLNYLFTGGTKPPEPISELLGGNGCAFDPTPGGFLDCTSFDACP